MTFANRLLETYCNCWRDKTASYVMKLALKVLGAKLGSCEGDQHLWPQTIACTYMHFSVTPRTLV